MNLAFAPQSPTYADTSQGRRYAVGRVFCVGRNYAAHAREMGRNPDSEPPFFFTKWASTVVPSGSSIPYAASTSDFQFEGELVVAIGRSGANIGREDALSHVFGYAAGLDMTRRDLQLHARDKGRPWDTGKNVECSAPLGVIQEIQGQKHIESGAITLRVNGEVKQQADLSDMIWPVPDIIAFLSKFYHLQPGDLIYTGTPAGVGPVRPGDSIEVDIAALETLKISVGPPALSSR